MLAKEAKKARAAEAKKTTASRLLNGTTRGITSQSIGALIGDFAAAHFPQSIQ